MGMGPGLTGRTVFKIVLDLREASFLCVNNGPGHDQMLCRPCNIGVTASAAIETIEWGQDPIEPWIFTITGWTETNEGRAAIARLLAIVQGHKDPIDLIAIEQGMPTIWA